MKTGIYSFQTTDGIVFDIFNHLKSNNYNVTYNVSTHISTNDKNIISYSWVFYILHKIIFKILRIFKFRYYWIRHLQEVIYDTIFSFKMNEGIILITTSGWIPKTLQKNKDLGGQNIFLCGNPCDLEISRILNLERKKTIKHNDIYNFQPRINNYVKGLKVTDTVIVFNMYCHRTFLNYYPKDKLISVNMVWPLNKRLFKITNISKNQIFTFCYIGHTILLKGLHVLLNAWSKVNIADAKLIIGGSIQPELKPFLFKKIAECNNVHYLGKVSDLNQFYRSSHVFICPSVIDAGPMTIPEAMYCKIPVIASENCGNSYLVDSEQVGLIYRNDNSDELSEKIIWFLENKEKTIKMGESAHKRIMQELSKPDQINYKIKQLINA